MKRLCAIGAALAMLAGPAHAQFKGMGDDKNPLKQEYEQRQREHKATEKAYEESLKRNRGAAAPVSNDPWATVRPQEKSKR